VDDFRVIVAGSRSFNNEILLREKLDTLLSLKVDTHRVVIVSGGARGADLLGEGYASFRGFSCERYPAQWDKFGKKAGLLRNEQMARVADALAAFWDGSSRGTKHMIDVMQRAGKLVEVVQF